MTHLRAIKIEKGVPMPTSRHRTSLWLDAFLEMDVGDSFRISTFKEMMRCSSAIVYFRKRGRTGHRCFTVRRAADGYWHCWRMPDFHSATVVKIDRSKRAG